MTVRFAFRTMLLAASAGALALGAAVPATAAPGGWEQRPGGGGGGGGGGDRGGGDRGENRWGGGARQQAPAQQAAPQQPRAPQPQVPQQPRGASAWQGGGGGSPPASGGWQGRPAGVPQQNPAPAWRNDGARAGGDPVVRTRPYGATPTPGGQPAWRGRDQGNPGNGGNAGTPGWQNGARQGNGQWSRDGDAARWHRDGGNDGGNGRNGGNWNNNWNNRDGNRGWNDRDRNDQGRNDRGRYDQGRDGQAWRNQGWNRNGDNRRWNNGWRNDNRYNWSVWRNQNRNVFHPGYYYAPFRGYSYSPLSIGIFLGAPFYAEQYWIADPWAYRLPPADGPYRWVRYYDDVILVDIYSGEVVDVIHDFFW